MGNEYWLVTLEIYFGKRASEKGTITRWINMHPGEFMDALRSKTAFVEDAENGSSGTNLLFALKLPDDRILSEDLKLDWYWVGKGER